MNDPGLLTLLLDIKEQQGAFGAQMIAAAQASARMEKSIEELKIKVGVLEPAAKAVAKMEPEVKELVELKNRGAAILVVGSVVVSAAFALVAAGVVAIFKNFATILHFLRGGA